MNNGVLIVIDMQKRFKASLNSDTQRACVREIKKAMKNNSHIMFVEYLCYGRTLSKLTSLTKNYKNKSLVIKESDDGSVEIRKTFEHLNIDPKKIRTVGVNTDCCVYETIKGLIDAYCDYNITSGKYSYKNVNIEVIKDACNSIWYHELGLTRLKELGVKVV